MRLEDAVPCGPDVPFGLLDDPDFGTVWGFDEAAGDELETFADVFRGSEAAVAARQARYVPVLASHSPVMDIGCGRGELLRLIARAGGSATGVDPDADMVARCVAGGLRTSAATTA